MLITLTTNKGVCITDRFEFYAAKKNGTKIAYKLMRYINGFVPVFPSMKIL